MQVIVTKPAFFNGSLLSVTGKPIELPDGTKGSWFAPVGSAEGQATADAAKAADKKLEPMALSEVSKQGGKSFVEVNAGKGAAKAADKGQADSSES